MYLAALTPAGEPDLTFGDAGTTRTALGKRSFILDLQMTTQGRLVGAGFVRRGRQLAVARWRANGSLDRSFGERGVVRTTFGSVTRATHVAVAPDGTLIVGASRDPFSDDGPALLRLTLDGAIDPSYGEGGLADLDDEPSGSPDALVIQPDGKAIALHETGFPTNDVLITRLARTDLEIPPSGKTASPRSSPATTTRRGTSPSTPPGGCWSPPRSRSRASRDEPSCCAF